MGKNLGVSRNTGVLFVSGLSALVMQACSSSAPLPPVVATGSAVQTAAAAKPGLKPASVPLPHKACDPSAAQLPPATGASIQQYFGAVVSRLGSLSKREREQMFVDRDIKGNRIAYAGYSGKARQDQDQDQDADAPTVAPWAHKDFEKDGIPGTSTERAKVELGLKTQGDPVIVAVIDSAVDTDHEALAAHVWNSPSEDPAFPGAKHGWNFLGGAKGNVYHTTLEVTREVKRMRDLKSARALTDKEQAYLTELEAQLIKGKGEAASKLAIRTKSRDQLAAALDVLKNNCMVKSGTLDEVQAIQSTNPAIVAARDAALASLKQGRDLAWYKNSISHWAASVELNEKYYYNLDFDSSSIVGDNPNVMAESYGNPDTTPEDAEEIHATHVSGIIGAVGGVKAGLEGQADNVRIMSLRAVPDGDERDKDIGNAIKFAVDHGARVINMSFGKSYSPHRDFVWQMLKYAASKEVLVVHAAGNDSLDNDVLSHYPDREVRDDDRNLLETIGNVIEVGASSVNKDKNLPAEFSDYGSRTVDLFAPGAQIYSTVPGNHYKELDGTSMATPEVAGIAALVLSQYPQLTAAQLKSAITGNVTSFSGLMVVKPSADPSVPESLVDFATLSQTAGVANSYWALKAAAKLLGL